MTEKEKCPICGHDIIETWLRRLKRSFKRVLQCPVCREKMWRNATDCMGQTDWYCEECGVSVIVNNPHFCPYCGETRMDFINPCNECGDVWKLTRKEEAK